MRSTIELPSYAIELLSYMIAIGVGIYFIGFCLGMAVKTYRRIMGDESER